MIRLIHTADIHLDACFANANMPPNFGNRRRQSLRDVFSGILERARASAADAVLIAGDLFEHDRVTRDTIAFLRERFSGAAPLPIFITPGNHDPYVPGSPYAAESWPENVHIFTEPKWRAVELEHIPLTVHGFAFDGYEISENPFGTLDVPSDGRRHVAVGHGSEKSHQPEGKEAYAPFDARLAVSPGLDYLALGHFHQVTAIGNGFDTTVYYSGAPEGHSFKETGPHYFLDVELLDGEATKKKARKNNPRKRVRVTPVPSANVVYETFHIDCSEFATTQQVVEALRERAADNGKRCIARCVLTGECDVSLQEELPTVADAAEGVFLFLDLVDQTQPIEDEAAAADGDTSLAAFLQRMGAHIADAPDEAKRAMLVRAREVGLAAYNNRDVPIRGSGGGAA